ncbi:SLBB domain-containing protein [Sphingomonas sp. 28-63-12]|uniref:SLBB domain-containing protein n=1 Tax=Sphingomonas sp. 28-63-12 TaxID=1970434 RepID=UPI000BDDDE12|nr:MAG: hypothetical protein B7Y47_10005 [Sphingomonas sp. 28-63-12]
MISFAHLTGNLMGRRRGHRQHRAAVALFSTVLAFCAMISGIDRAVAQTVPRQTSTVPYGSPTSPDLSQPNSQTTTDPTQPTQQQSDPRIQPVDIQGTDRTRDVKTDTTQQNDQNLLQPAPNLRLKPLVPSQFEKFVAETLGRKLPRFGSELLLPGNRDYAVPATATVPPDYILNVGDTITISLTGSVEGSVDVEMDTEGKIFLPKVGAIMLAGVRYRDLHDTVAAALGRQYRGYDVAVSIRKLRGIRVYVTGFANNPGAYSVNSLSTMVNAVLAAGGPSSGGSLRSVKLFRNGRLVTDFDLYDLILRGDRSRDAILQNEDVLFIAPLGRQVAITGSVNSEAIYEVREGDSLASVVAYAGGTNDLADDSRVLLYRLTKPKLINGREVSRAEAETTLATGGDILQILSEGTLQRPLANQAVLVRIEGEVVSPGNYFVPPNTPLSAVIARAGGMTDQAFVFGTRLERLSVKRQQRESFLEAVNQLEFALLSAPLSNSDIGVAGDRSTQLAAASAALAKLKAAEPDGRVVLNLQPGNPTLPGEILMENNDRIVIPPRPFTVGVFGAVYRPASFFIGEDRGLRIKDYIERAGGKQRSADGGGIIVVRANGDVLSRRRGALNAYALPGDVVFVPIKTQSTSILAKIRDISAIIFQIGISAAAFVAIAK